MADTHVPSGGSPGGGQMGGPGRPVPRPALGNPDLPALVGVAAVVFPLVYFASELVEVAQGNFSTGRLVLTYIGEAGIVFSAIGLYAVQRPYIGRLGLYGALAYAYSFAFFTGTVVYALAAGSKNWTAVTDVFGVWMTVHGAIMVLGGIAFGLAIIWARALPRWTGALLILGVVFVAVVTGMSSTLRAVAAALPAAAFIGMGLRVLREHARSA